jgi:hypothetical protein
MSERLDVTPVPYDKKCPRCGRSVGETSTYLLVNPPANLDDTIPPGEPMLVLGLKHDSLCANCEKESE